MQSLIGIWKLVEARAFDNAGQELPPPFGPQPMGLALFEAERMVGIASDARASATRRLMGATITGRERMIESKLERDARRNAGLGDIYVDTAAEPWINFSPGIDFKLLRTSQETGAWTALFKCAAGSSFARHEHLAAGEYLMLSGKMEIRGGAERGGVTAKAGDYGYEANGMWHDDTCFPEETVLYFTNFGAIRFVDDDDNTLAVVDYKMLREIAEVGRQKLAA